MHFEPNEPKGFNQKISNPWLTLRSTTVPERVMVSEI
jgi:hypothetical protein